MVESLSVPLFDEAAGGASHDETIELMRVEGQIRPADGGFLLEADFEENQAFQGPGVGPRGMVRACAATAGGLVTPGEAGPSVFEVRLASYEHEGEKVNCWLDSYGRTSDVVLPSEGQLEMRWGIALGTGPGMVHSKRPVRQYRRNVVLPAERLAPRWDECARWVRRRRERERQPRRRAHAERVENRGQERRHRARSQKAELTAGLDLHQSASQGAVICRALTEPAWWSKLIAPRARSFRVRSGGELLAHSRCLAARSLDPPEQIHTRRA